MGIKKSIITSDSGSSVAPVDFDELTQKAAAKSSLLSKSPLFVNSPKPMFGPPKHVSSPISQEQSLSADLPDDSEMDDRLGMGNMRRHKQASSSWSSSSAPSSRESKATSSSDYFSSSREHEERQSLERLRSLQGAHSISSEDFNPNPYSVNKSGSASPSSSFSDLTQTGIETIRGILSKSKSKVCNMVLLIDLYHYQQLFSSPVAT